MSKCRNNIQYAKDSFADMCCQAKCNSSIGLTSICVYDKAYCKAEEQTPYITKNISLATHNTACEQYFSNILSHWIEYNRLRLKGGTINKYQSLIETHILPELGKVKMSKISSTMINAFLANKMESGRLDKKGGLAASYVRSIMLIINAAINFAVAEQMCPPMKTPICKPILRKKDLRILSIDEQKRLETNLLKKLDPIRAGILISLHTGLRIGEICALTWENIDLQNRIIKVRHTIARVRNNDPESDQITQLILDSPKTKSSARDIPISSALLPIILQIKPMNTSKFVISSKDKFISPRTLEYRYHILLKESGIHSINYHALRHTFATRCIEAGMDVKSLSEILGHANVGITLNTYVHSSIEMKRAQLEKLTFL